MADEIRTTYLAAHQPLGKTFSPDGVTPYPLVKKFTSLDVVVPATQRGMQERLVANRKHSVHGNALLRGNPRKALVNEPRAGAVDPLENNRVLVLDVDNLRVPDALMLHEHKNKTRRIAEYIIDLLPEVFHDASCLCSASSSMGTKNGVVSMHFEFWLSEAQSPAWHRNLLRHLNLITPMFKQQLELSASGTAFRWKVDPAMASNAQIRYIAVPQFLGGVANPIPDVRHRHFMLRKDNVLLDVAALNVPVTVDGLVTRAMNEFRHSAGLPAKKESMAFIGGGDHRTAVVTNPDRIKMEFVRDTDKFVYYNINGGDSNAYYVRKLEPHVVFNFKGEPPFMFQAADPEAYQEHLTRWVLTGDAEKKDTAPPLPIVFRDPAVDTYFNGLIEVGTGRVIEMHPVRSLKAMGDFLSQRDNAMPDPVPEFSYRFEPNKPYTFDPVGKRINKYHAPDIAIEPTEPFSWEQSIDWLAIHCPGIRLLTTHVLGNDLEAAKRFMNWLAVIFQTKQKLTTAWVMQGCQGTGKGVLFNRVLMPLIGAEYCKNTTVEALEEQFNAQFEDALLIMFDEFRLDTSKQADKVYNKLKNMIGEKTITIREMRQTRVQRLVFFNCLFASNDHDVIRVPSDDRRLNVAPRQNVPLKDIVNVNDLFRQIDQELPYLAGALGAMGTNLSLAEIPLKNDARAELQLLSETTVDEFVRALNEGDIDYFLDAMEMDHTASTVPLLPAARSVIRRWLGMEIIPYNDADCMREHLISNEDLRVLYCVLIAPIDSIKKFVRMLSLHGITNRGRTNTLRGVRVQWTMNKDRHEKLIEKYITSTLPANVAQLNR